MNPTQKSSAHHLTLTLMLACCSSLLGATDAPLQLVLPKVLELRQAVVAGDKDALFALYAFEKSVAEPTFKIFEVAVLNKLAGLIVVNVAGEGFVHRDIAAQYQKEDAQYRTSAQAEARYRQSMLIEQQTKEPAKCCCSIQ